MKVFVLDNQKEPLAPTRPSRAKHLLRDGKAAVYRRFPFTILLKRAVENPQVPDLRVKLDPGSKTTGIAVVDDQSGKVVFAAELSHRGHAIKEWLAWQERPGTPLGLALTTRYFDANASYAQKLIHWLHRLFNIEPALHRVDLRVMP